MLNLGRFDLFESGDLHTEGVEQCLARFFRHQVADVVRALFSGLDLPALQYGRFGDLVDPFLNGLFDFLEPNYLGRVIADRLIELVQNSLEKLIADSVRLQKFVFSGQG